MLKFLRINNLFLYPETVRDLRKTALFSTNLRLRVNKRFFSLSLGEVTLKNVLPRENSIAHNCFENNQNQAFSGCEDF